MGLLGPNGAGKTTTVSIIAGLLRPDSGAVLIEGRALGGDTDPVKRKIGLVPQDIALYDELPAYDNLTFFGALYDLDGAAAKLAIDGDIRADDRRDRQDTRGDPRPIDLRDAGDGDAGRSLGADVYLPAVAASADGGGPNEVGD